MNEQSRAAIGIKSMQVAQFLRPEAISGEACLRLVGGPPRAQVFSPVCDNCFCGGKTMTLTLADILLWLFVLDLGIAFGAGLYEQRIVVPQWFTCSRESGLQVNGKTMQEMDVGRKFWAWVTTMPLTILTVASLIIAPLHSWIIPPLQVRGGAVRFWWLTAAAFALLDRIATFSFFIPRALRLMRADSLPSGSAGRMASLWMAMNWIRLALLLAAWLAALKALSVLHAVAYSVGISFGP